MSSYGGPKARFRKNLDAIKLAKQLAAEQRQATPAEQQVLAQFSGWGHSTLAQQLFKRARYQVNPDWTSEWEALKEVLTPDEWESALNSTLNAHYTEPGVVRAMWRAAEWLGIKRVNHPRVLEPAIGAGAFFGTMPPELAARSIRTGTDLDPLTATIAKNLYQNADIYNVGFEKLRLADNSQHLTITNVPFFKEGVIDPEFNIPGMRFLQKPLHNYFFAKAIKKTAPGGIVMAITSRYSMDAQAAQRFREWMSEQADLLGAVRLPNDTFEQNAGTQVVTDLLIFRKRMPGEAPKPANWLDLVEITTPQGKTMINRYFAEHPDAVLGQHALKGTMYSGGEYTVLSTGEDLEAALDKVLQQLPQNVMATNATEAAKARAAAPSMRQGALVRENGQILRNDGEVLRPVQETGTKLARLNGLLDVREAALEVRTLQQQGADDATFAAALKRLNQTYDGFVKKYGLLNANANRSVVAGDNEFLFVQGLEDAKGEKMPFFFGRTISRDVKPTKAGSAIDALTISMQEKARVDMDLMQQLTGKSESELASELGNQVFFDPIEGWVTREQYLSGATRSKLKTAEQAAAQQPEKYARNVEALKEVQPPEVEAANIFAQLGSPWIPTDVVRDWVNQLIPGSGADVGFVPAAGVWTLSVGDSGRFSAKNTLDLAVFDEAGKRRKSGTDLIDDLLNGRQTLIYDRVGDGETERQVLNGSATAAANAMRQQLQDEFVHWLWSDGDRLQRLQNIYNDTYNDYVPPKWDGSHLAFPGMSPQMVQMLRPTQKNAVWRTLQSGNLLIAHGVGAGKTLTLASAAMEMRRMGLANKPLIVTPKRVVSGFEKQFREAYPGARLLVAGIKDFEPENRMRMMGRIASGDWDAIIISVDQMNKLPVRPQAWRDYILEQIRILQDYMDEAAKTKGKNSADTKAIAAAMAKLYKKLETLQERAALAKDDALYFEDLGVDALFVDEAHKYKNLWFPTKMGRVKGVPRSDSNRAFDMYLKVRDVRRRSGGRNIVFATATPISNSVAEAYTIMRYMMPDALRQMNLEHFDSWAAMFGELSEQPEMQVTGSGLNMVSRFRQFSNVPELRRALYRVMDVVRTEDVPGIKLPKSQIIERIAPRDSTTDAVIKWLDERVDAMHGSSPVPPEVDNMGKLTTEMRAAATYPQWYPRFANMPESPTSKINNAVKDIYDEYVRMNPQRGTQLVFLDVGVPGGAFGDRNSYDMIKNRLVARGVPANEIAYVQDADTDAKIMQLMAAMNEGTIRVLLGGRDQMAEGLNIQKRIGAVHHVDVPLKPDKMIQADGRAIRHGNMWYDLGEPVRIYRHGQEPFDSFIYGLLEDKARSYYQLMGVDDGKGGALGELDEVTANFAQIKAMTTGDPRFLRQIELQTLLKRMGAEYVGYQAKRAAGEHSLPLYQTNLQTLRQEQQRLEEIAPHVQVGERPLTAQIGSEWLDFKNRTDLAKALGDHVGKAITTTPSDLAEYRGFTLTGFQDYSQWENKWHLRFELKFNDYPIAKLTDEFSLTQLDNAINNVPGAMVAEVKQRIAKVQNDIRQVQETLQQEWPQAAEYQRLQEEYRTLTAELMQKANRQADRQIVTAGGSEVDDAAATAGQRGGIIMNEADIPPGVAGFMLRPGIPPELRWLWRKLREAAKGPFTQLPEAPQHNFGGLRDNGNPDLADLMRRQDTRIGLEGGLRQPTVGDGAAYRIETIDQLRRRLLAELDQVGKAPLTLSNQQKMQVLGAVAQMLPQYDNVLAGVTKGAQAISDFAMLDYSKVHGFDTALALMVPYHFWFTRSAKNWLERSVFKPSVLANYLRIKNAIDKQNERENVPSRFKGTIGVPGTDIRIANPYNLLIPYQQLFELNDFGDTTQNPNTLQKFVETGKMLGFGLNPLLESAYMLASGRGRELQAGDWIPQYRLLNYAYKTITGQDLPGAGDEYDPYRDGRTVGRMMAGGQVDPQTALWLMDRIYQRQQGVKPLPEEAAAEQQTWDALLKQAGQQSGFERLLPLLTRFLTGTSAYQYPREEAAMRAMQAQRRGLGYGPDNQFGSQAAVNAFDAASGYGSIKGPWTAKDALIPGIGENVAGGTAGAPGSQPYQPTRPGIVAVDAQRKQLKQAINQEMAAAVEAALAQNPNMRSAQLKAVKAPYQEMLTQLDSMFPSATDWKNAPERDFYGNMSPEELLAEAQKGVVYQALDELAPMKPQAGASRQQWDAYNAALEKRVAELMSDPAALSAQVYGRPVTLAAGTGGTPGAALPTPTAGAPKVQLPAGPTMPASTAGAGLPMAGPNTTSAPRMGGEFAPAAPMAEQGPLSDARRLIDATLGANQTPAEQAYWVRQDQRAAAWGQRKAAVYGTFGQDVGRMYDQYLALPSGSQERKDYRAQHPELRAVSLFTFHPQEYADIVGTFGQEGVLAWAKMPAATDSKARAAYYDRNPMAFLVQAWVYGRPGGQSEQDTAADEAFQYDFGRDFVAAMDQFGTNIWEVVGAYRRGWDKTTKKAFYQQNPQLSPFFDWWYGNLPQQASPYANVGRRFGGGGGGGGRGYSSNYRMRLRVDPRYMDRNLWQGVQEMRPWRQMDSNMADLSWTGAGRQLEPRPVQKWRRERPW